MLNFGNKEFRNLQEQVLKNAQDIDAIKQGAIALAQFGIYVVGSVDDASELPDPDEYLAEGGTYGDAYAVGEETPYVFYVFTRPLQGETQPRWLNIGQFPLPGPQGETGATGATGTTPNLTATASASTLAAGQSATVSVVRTGTDEYPIFGFTFAIPRGQQGIQGPQGEQGIQGIQGPQGIQGVKGDPGYLYNIIGQVASEAALPDPEEVRRDSAYLVGASAPYYVYIIIGDSPDRQWINIGQIATVEPDTYIANNSWATSGTLDSGTLAAINADMTVHYIKVGTRSFQLMKAGYYVCLDWDTVNSVGVMYRMDVDLSTGAWTIEDSEILTSTTGVDLTGNQTITGTKTFNKIKGTSAGGFETTISFNGSNFFIHKNADTEISYYGANKYIQPNSGWKLGITGHPWSHAYIDKFNTTLNGTGYGLTLPSTASLTADSELLDTASAQTITGAKTFSNDITAGRLKNANGTGPTLVSNDIDFYCGNNRVLSLQSTAFFPRLNIDCGRSNNKWKDLYLSGVLSDGTNSVPIADLAALITYAKAQGWIS